MKGESEHRVTKYPKTSGGYVIFTRIFKGKVSVGANISLLSISGADYKVIFLESSFVVVSSTKLNLKFRCPLLRKF